jgi:hypothetical protein
LINPKQVRLPFGSNKNIKSRDNIISEPLAMPETIIIHVLPESLNISIKEVGRYAGGSRYRMDADMEQLASKMLDRAKKIISPAVAYAIHPVTSMDFPKGICLDGNSYIQLPFEEQDTSVVSLTAVVCTLGARLDNKIKDLTIHRKILEGTVLDAVGVALLESLGMKGRIHLKKEAQKRGLFAGCPFGPGYGKMPLAAQSTLFKHIDSQAIGIRLNKSGVMLPLKSLSFWLRWTTNPREAENHGYKCQRCDLRNCLYRKVPYLETRNPIEFQND